MFIFSKNSLVILLSVLLIYGCNANTSQQNTDTENYPKPHCGESLPQNKEAYPVSYYPVYAENVADNLSIIRSQFCQDALARNLANVGRVIQVASFQDREKADLFRQFLDRKISGKSLVGKPSIIRNPVKPK